jgi:DNA invertase Pin-like site-specific DNA recombinase
VVVGQQRQHPAPLARAGVQDDRASLGDRHRAAERTAAGLAAARARGRHDGRPSVTTTHKLQVAQQMYRSGQYSVAAIAKTLGVSRASVSRHLTGDSR